MDLKTDLILEIASGLEKSENDYTIQEQDTSFGFLKTVVEVKTKAGSNLLNKQKGYYITLDATSEYVLNKTVKNNIVFELKECLIELIKKTHLKTPKKVLVVGLGNSQMISDSLGPKVVEKITVTRHIKEVIKEDLEKLNSISAIATGVLGTTGIETASMVALVVKEVKPELVIVIDTLSTMETKRIASSFQLTNAGIAPGAGVGNHRKELNKETLGVPVVVIGVPLVQYAYSLCKEVLEKVVDNIKEIEKFEPDLKQIASNMLGDLVVTTKDIDQVVEHASDIISLVVNMVVNPNLMIDEL